MAMTNQYIEAAANTIYELSSDESVQEQCRRREEFEHYQRLREQKITVLSRTVAEKEAVIADIKAENAQLKELLADALEKLHKNQS